MELMHRFPVYIQIFFQIQNIFPSCRNSKSKKQEYIFWNRIPVGGETKLIRMDLFTGLMYFL